VATLLRTSTPRDEPTQQLVFTRLVVTEVRWVLLLLLVAVTRPLPSLAEAGTGTASVVGQSVAITDPYVPSGSRSFHVENAAGFAIGDTVHVDRPVTDAWLHFMRMDALVRDGLPQTWLSSTTVIHTDQVITDVQGTAITVDAPLSDSLDSAYVKYFSSPRAPRTGSLAPSASSPRRRLQVPRTLRRCLTAPLIHRVCLWLPKVSILHSCA